MRKLSDFDGRWRLTRQIIHVDGQQMAFAGNAIWSPYGKGLRYMEQGELTLPDKSQIYAERVYQWSGELEVHFADGRYFHKVPSEGGQTQHWCDPDMYDGTYDFEGWPRWQVSWTVKGPAKNYRSNTTYERDA